MFRQAVHQWFWDCYDHLGRLVAANFLMVALVGLPGFFALLAVGTVSANLPPLPQALLHGVAFMAVAPLLGFAWFAPLLHFGGFVALDKDPPLRTMMGGFRAAGWRTWALMQIGSIAAGLMLLNIWFYGASGLFPAHLKAVGMGLAGLCFWILFFLAAAMLVALPAAIREGAGPVAALKRGGMALLRHPSLCIGTLVFLISLWIVGAYFKMAGVILFGFSGTAMLMNSAFDVLKEAERNAAAKQPDSGPANWKDVTERDKAAELERQRQWRYRRTFRDVLKPWEGE